MEKLHHNARDLTDQRFGRLIALYPIEKRNNNHSIVWFCKCDCGNECFVNGVCLRRGSSQSCGCLQRELVGKRFTKHGYRKHPLYSIWCSMIFRCENPDDKSYKNYGGRGISVCESWHKIENFLEDMGERPEGLTLERKNNDGDYTPENCKWATYFEQIHNRRDSKNQHWFFAFNIRTGEWDEDNNQHEFAKRHKLIQNSISDCLHGKRKMHKDWTFENLTNP